MAFGDRIRRALGMSARTENRDALASSDRIGFGPSLTHGGVVNRTTGLGMVGQDKNEGSFFSPTRFYWRPPLEVLRVQSAAARKFVEMPIDDMFIRWRAWQDGDVEGVAEIMEEAELKHKLTARIAEAMKSARAYGTGVLVLMTTEAPMNTPLFPERIKEGDLKAIRVFDRYDMSVLERDKDLFSPNYNCPVTYHVHPTGGYAIPLEVHHTRVIRFDGITPLTDSRYYSYEQDWGVSELVPAIVSLVEDQSLAAAVAHLSQEASIPVLSIQGLRELMAGRGGRGEPTIEDLGSTINQMKSVYNLLMVDGSTDEFSRERVNFAGLDKLMDKFSERLASMADIPSTRWQGRSPAGFSATGESDMKNYVMMLEAKRQRMLANPLPILDEVIARDAGLGEVPEFEWLSLLDLSEKEQAEVSKIKVETVAAGIQAALFDEDEGREILDGDAMLGTLSGPAPEPEEPEIDESALASMFGQEPPANDTGGDDEGGDDDDDDDDDDGEDDDDAA